MINLFKKKQIQEPFVVDFPNWDNLTKETAQFIFVECEKRLNNSMVSFDQHREKSFKILGFLLPIITIAVGYAMFIDYKLYPEKLIPSCLFCILQVIGVIMFVLVIAPRAFATTGAEPQEIIIPSAIIADDKLQQIGLMIAVCERMQDKINSNRYENDRASILILLGLVFSAILAPIAFFISFLLV